MKRIFLFLTLFGVALSTSSFVTVASTETLKESRQDAISQNSTLHPIIHEMDIKSNILNRYATTLVVSKVQNANVRAKEVTFTLILPEQAFISEFSMEIGGKSYKAYVKEKEEAENIYNRAILSGQSAALVAASAKESNRFTVSVNVEAESTAVFRLTYEELLQRKNNQYELVLNIHPGQIVKQMNVEVKITENRPLRFVKTPSLRSGNEIDKNQRKLDTSPNIKMINYRSALVKFNPDVERQKQFAKDFGTKESEGLAEQFVVQYDVDRTALEAYKLGDHVQVRIYRVECMKTSVNATGLSTCMLLKDYPEVYYYLTNFQVYQQYFCPIRNKFAGVCCPKKTNYL